LILLKNAHVTVSKLVALSVCWKILYGSHGNTIKICRFHGSLGKKGSRPLLQKLQSCASGMSCHHIKSKHMRIRNSNVILLAEVGGKVALFAL